MTSGTDHVVNLTEAVASQSELVRHGTHPVFASTKELLVHGLPDRLYRGSLTRQTQTSGDGGIQEQHKARPSPPARVGTKWVEPRRHRYT
jgi:hypothetical protein